MVKSFILIGLLLQVALSVYVPRFTYTIPAQSSYFQYSSDNSFLGISSGNRLTILNGHYPSSTQEIQFPIQYGISTFSFSSDSNLLAIGFKNGEVRIYGQNNQIFEPLEKNFKTKQDSLVTSICFTADSQAIVIGSMKNQVTYYQFNKQLQSTKDFGGNFVLTVSCSPKDPNIFLVAGGLNKKPRVSFYQFKENTIALAKNIEGLSSLDAIQSSTYSSSASVAYLSDSEGAIYKCNTNDYTLEKISFPELKGKSLSKIRVSQNEKVIVLAYPNSIAILESNDGNYKISVFNSTANSVGSTLKTGYVFYSDINGKGVVLGKCQKNLYYDDATDSCVSCQQSCQVCQKSPEQCYNCLDSYYLKEKRCLKCSSGCLSCVNEGYCNQCGEHFILYYHVCICQEEYFLKEDKCQKCSAGCKECDDQITCNQCKKQFSLIDNQCVCPKGTYQKDDTCLPCNRGCLACENAQSCMQCQAQNHFILVDNNCICDFINHFKDDGEKCVCMDSFYYDQDTCKSCSLGCLTCISQSECQICKEGLKLQNGRCLCEKEQYLDQNGVCHNCQQTLKYCTRCTSAQTCTFCQAGIHRAIKQGKCQCQQGYFPDQNDICQPCLITGCKQCADLKTCKVCDAQHYWELDLTNQQCKCFKNYSRFQDKCVQCSKGCKLCDQTKCLECDNENNWINNQKGECICRNSYYQDKEQCKKCMLGCLTCIKGQYCNQCDITKHFQNRQGICVCQSGFYPFNEDCISCSSAILHCSQCSNKDSCSKCQEPFILNSTNHKCTCPNGKYVDGDKCTSCPSGCTTCVSSSQCTSCSQGYVLKNNQCKKKSHLKEMILIIIGVMGLASIIFRLLR